jgi:hypothetical protein
VARTQSTSCCECDTVTLTAVMSLPLGVHHRPPRYVYVSKCFVSGVTCSRYVCQPDRRHPPRRGAGGGGRAEAPSQSVPATYHRSPDASPSVRRYPRGRHGPNMCSRCLPRRGGAKPTEPTEPRACEAPGRRASSARTRTDGSAAWYNTVTSYKYRVPQAQTHGTV